MVTEVSEVDYCNLLGDFLDPSDSQQQLFAISWFHGYTLGIFVNLLNLGYSLALEI